MYFGLFQSPYRQGERMSPGKLARIARKKALIGQYRPSCLSSSISSSDVSSVEGDDNQSTTPEHEEENHPATPELEDSRPASPEHEENDPATPKLKNRRLMFSRTREDVRAMYEEFLSRRFPPSPLENRSSCWSTLPTDKLETENSEPKDHQMSSPEILQDTETSSHELEQLTAIEEEEEEPVIDIYNLGNQQKISARKLEKLKRACKGLENRMLEEEQDRMWEAVAEGRPAYKEARWRGASPMESRE